MSGGRPFRFLATTLGGWVALRTLVLMTPESEELVARSTHAGPPAALPGGPAAALSAEPALLLASIPSPSVRAAASAPRRTRRPTLSILAVTSVDHAAEPSLPMPEPSSPTASAPPPRTQDVPVMLLPVRREPLRADAVRRWSAGAWSILRGSGRGDPLGASQLGGSQLGGRVAYMLDDAGRVAIVGRVATPLHGRGREASLGVEWKPTPLPVRVFVERRIALDGGRGGPGVGLVGGVYRELGDVRFEGYAQSGVVRRERTEPYVDGAARVAKPVATLGAAHVDLGLGAWGGAQRGAGRLDVGPSVGTRVAVGGHGLRVSLDWRERVAGDARPGSGPALSIGADF